VANIHPTAVIHPDARLADDCKVGPFCQIGERVTVGGATEIGHGCHLAGDVTIGRNNTLYPYCCIGTPPQDISYAGDVFAVEIGDDNVLREFCTVNMGTAKDRELTTIGNHNYLMSYVHIGHDCVIGNHTILINNVGISGHTLVEDHAIISGLTGLHHFVTVGKYAFLGGMSRIIHDAPPFMTTEGNPSRVHRVNIIGLQRHGFSQQSIDALRRAHRVLYRSKLTRPEAFNILESGDEGTAPEVQYLIDFLKKQMAGRQGRQREIRRATPKQ
jgi:UDP-N-acetylglucosamine acyltransferase